MHYVLRHQQSFIRTSQINLFSSTRSSSYFQLLSSAFSTPRLPTTITNTLYIHIPHTHSVERILAVYLLGPLCLVLFSVCLCRDVVVSSDRSILSCILSLLNEIGNPSYRHDIPVQTNRRQIKGRRATISVSCPSMCSLVQFSFGFLNIVSHQASSSIFLRSLSTNNSFLVILSCHVFFLDPLLLYSACSNISLYNYNKTSCKI